MKKYYKKFNRFFRKTPAIIFIGGVIILLLIIYLPLQKITTKSSSYPQQINSPFTTMPVSEKQSESLSPKQIFYPSVSPAKLSKNSPTITPSPTSACRLGQPTPVIPDPSVRIDSILPTSGKIGDIIIIRGSGFGKSSFYYSDPTKFLGGVSFYGIQCGYNSGGAPPAEEGAGWWNDDNIKVKVPGVASGVFQIEVKSSDGKRSNRMEFRVIE